MPLATSDASGGKPEGCRARDPLAWRAGSRPAGLEPATPGLEGSRKEATRGGGTPLPLILLGFSQTRDHPDNPNPLPIVQYLSSRLSRHDF